MSDHIQTGLNAIFQAFEKAHNKEIESTYEAIKDQQLVKNLIESVNNRDPDSFNTLSYFTLNYLESIISQVSIDPKVIFLFSNYDFVYNNIEKIITEYEGNSFCADKARTITKSLSEFLIDGYEIGFNFEQEYTYHIPKKILNNHKDIVMLFDGLYELYYGRIEKFVHAIKIIIDTGNEANERERLSVSE